MRNFQSLHNTAYDLIVIGGGINGAATARDAALRGLTTLLIDKNDFASGTTSWSTRLIHGGLRYLEHFEFNLVRESLRERELLLHLAPHLVHPIQLTIPIYRRGSRSYWEIQAGMILYDLLSFDKSLPNHRMLPATKMQQLFRSIDAEGLTGAAQYYDGQAVYAERLCLETILSAQEAGADVWNYLSVEQIHQHQGRITALTCLDTTTDTELQVHLRENGVCVNTAGPWVDQVCARGYQDGQPAPIGAKPKIGGTKGSHIIVAPFPGAPDSAFYVEAKSDGRPFFIVPWLQHYLIGTTDLRYQGDLDRVKASDEEVDYLITETNRVFPTASLSRHSVLFTYSGVRPLPYAEGKKPGSITRNHILFDHAAEGVANLISLIGGKLTTHRQVGEELVDAVYRKRQETPPVSLTRTQPLPGAIAPTDARIQQAVADYRQILPVATIDHLFSLYGARALEVLALAQTHADLRQPLSSHTPDIRAQVVYAVQAEMALTLVDICRRRLLVATVGNYGLDTLSPMIEVLQQYCGWSAERCDRTLRDYHTYLAENCIPDYALASTLNPPSLSATVS